jgi:Fe-S cluster assembly protein SufD
MVAGKRHVDNHLVVEHAKAHCDSREYFKGILDGQGKGIFSGRIIVRPGAQKTDAKQTNASLLLSQDAQVESKPQLEIFADDVKCTHGATIGQLDKDAMFYLRARGIHKDAAQSLMVYAFANDVLERVQVEPLRSQLVELMISRLPQGDLLRQAS